MIRPEIITSVIVHAGTFHADDALAAALVLTAAGRDIPVKRYFTVPEGLPDTVIVADIGRGKFDHHQDDARCRADGSKYAACGLLYEELQEWRKWKAANSATQEDFWQRLTQRCML